MIQITYLIYYTLTADYSFTLHHRLYIHFIYTVPVHGTIHHIHTGRVSPEQEQPHMVCILPIDFGNLVSSEGHRPIY